MAKAQKYDAFTALSSNSQSGFGYRKKGNSFGVIQQICRYGFVRSLLLIENLCGCIDSPGHIGRPQIRGKGE
jgi:hypothetical protein